jgi:hypothetical protein
MSPAAPADTFIQKTKKLYQDTRTQRNIERLNADIAEVHSIMTRNIQDVLGQGERLDRERPLPATFFCCMPGVGHAHARHSRHTTHAHATTSPRPCIPAHSPRAPSRLPRHAGMTEMSTMLSQDARQFAVKAKDLYHQALFRKYLPWVVIGGALVLVLGVRWAFY